MYIIVASEDIITNARGEHNFQQMAKQAFSETLPPRNLWIIEGSNSHGFDLLDEAGVVDSLVDWFVDHMPSPYSD